MTPEHIDLQVLEEYVGTAPQNLVHFTQLAFTSLGAALAPLSLAMAQRDIPTLQACGHRAKSTALHIGAQDFADTCQALEEAARAGQTAQALALACQLQARLQPLQLALQSAVAQRLARQPR